MDSSTTTVLPAETTTSAPVTSTTVFTATPPAERWVEGSRPFAEWLVSCAAEHGEVLEIAANAPALRSVSSRSTEVMQDCWDHARANDWTIEIGFDDEESQRLHYRLFVEAYECLVDLGYPAVDPPSEDAFVDGGARWHPCPGGHLVILDGSAPSRDSGRLAAQEQFGGYLPELLQDHYDSLDGG